MANPTPPPRPPPRDRRTANWLNVFLPGAGLFYLGRRTIGAMFAAAFLTCLGSALVIFLAGYARYFSLTMSGNLLEGDRLEQIGQAFHPRWLVGLAMAGLAIHVTSMLWLWLGERQGWKHTVRQSRSQSLVGRDSADP